jgi:hypothetical protein
MTDKILPMGYPPKTRRVRQPYIDQIAALSARLADADAALATARGDLAQYSCRCIGPMPDCAQGDVADCGWTARAAIALIPARPPALS